MSIEEGDTSGPTRRVGAGGGNVFAPFRMSRDDDLENDREYNAKALATWVSS